MRFGLAAATALVAVVCVKAQQKGTLQAEVHPPLTTYNCASNGDCTPDTSTSIVLDANWRWTHAVGSSTNCYTGETWDTSLCPDPVTCAKSCAIDGANYEGVYGVTASGDSVGIKLVTVGQYDTNIGARTYVMDTPTTYKMYQLKNREFVFDVDVSTLPCGVNGALYFVQMDADGGLSKYPLNQAGAAYGTGYCDAQCPQDIKFINGEANILDWTPSPTDPNSGTGSYGTCCTEMDIWEANSISSAVTPHDCTTNGQYRCNGTSCGEGPNRFNGVCDKDGCDLNPYRGGNTGFYGPGAAPGPSCNLLPNTNNMGTIMGSPTIETDPVGCCAVCSATHGCVGFTFVEASSNCFLKSALGSPVADPGATSGSVPPSAPRPNALRMGLGAEGGAVDTTKPFTVITQFITSDGTDSGDLVEIKRSFVQNGVAIPSPPMGNIPAPNNNLSSITDAMCKAKAAAYADNDNFEAFGGLKRMGDVLDTGMVLVLSQWVDYAVHMLWLDSDYPGTMNATAPGVARGTCSTSSGNPPDVINNTPDSTVTFSKISLGPIGFTEAALKRGKGK